MPAPAPPPPALALPAVAGRPCSGRLAAAVTPLEHPDDPRAPQRVRLTLRNLGTGACALFVSPRLDFADAAGRPLSIRAATPFGWHHGGIDLGHGPMQRTIDLAPGASASLDLSWNGATAGPVCLKAHSIAVAAAEGGRGVDPPALRWDATVCGGYADDVRVEETPLAPDGGR